MWKIVERCALHHDVSHIAKFWIIVCAVAYVWVGRLLICFNRYLGLVLMRPWHLDKG